jgi:hypothetical protein
MSAQLRPSRPLNDAGGDDATEDEGSTTQRHPQRDDGIQAVKKFTDKNGNVVRMLSVGQGAALSFMNVSTGATLSLKAQN